MIELPQQPSSRPPWVALLGVAVVIGALAGAAYVVFVRPAPAALAAPAAAVPALPPAEDAGAQDTVTSDAGPVADAGAPLPSAATRRRIQVVLNGPLEMALRTQTADAARLSQVVARTLVWWLRVPNELERRDVLTVVYDELPSEDPVVWALRLVSGRKGKTFEAFRHQADGNPFPRMYDADGAEIERHLKDSPLDGWEQITSLLRDGRGHKGIDLKTPSGTPVRATFDGTITRRNWNFRGGGNSLEIQHAKQPELKALFLHLSPVPAQMKPGRTVRRGEVIATSGNTGRSFAPHLHYQLMRHDKPVDPFIVHGATVQRLTPAQLAPFHAAAADLRRALDTPPSPSPSAP